MSNLVFILVVLLPMLGLSGLAIDGGQVLVERRVVQGIADGAARAGATEHRSRPTIGLIRSRPVLNGMHNAHERVA